MGYSFWLTARIILYAQSHRLCYTSRGALAGTRNMTEVTMLWQIIQTCNWVYYLVNRFHITNLPSIFLTQPSVLSVHSRSPVCICRSLHWKSVQPGYWMSPPDTPPPPHCHWRRTAQRNTHPQWRHLSEWSSWLPGCRSGRENRGRTVPCFLMR